MHLSMPRLFCSLLLVVFCSLGCEGQEAVPIASCSNAGVFVRQAKKIDGTVFYNSSLGSYGIQVATSFDSADMGFACNLPTEYQKELLKVRFSGSYHAYDKPINGAAGYRFYYLTVESISK
jgi:hypothetical protein